MTVADELRKALPYAQAWGAASRSLAFRRIAELLIRAQGTDDIALRIQTISALERLRPQVSALARRDVARRAAEQWPDRLMLWLFREEPVDVVAPLAARVRIDGSDWAALARELPPAVQALLAGRPAPDRDAPVTGALSDGARRIGELRHRLAELASPPSLPALASDWRWECDARGRVGFVDGDAPVAPGAGLFDLDESGALWSAFARRAPFRDVEVAAAERRWKLSGVPFFEKGTGAFLGYRGAAIRAASPGLFGSTTSSDALAKLAHEVRSPLNAIMGFAQIIERETLGAAPEADRRRATAILDNANRLLGALDDLTDAARLERGHWPLAPETVDAAELVARLVERSSPIAAARNVGIAATVAGGIPLVVADRHSLERAIKRLLAAVIAVAEKGETILVGAQRAGGGARLFVTRPAALDELTAEALYDTADAAREGAAAPLLGLGFGLRLVRQLAETIGAEFAIEPHRFTLTFRAGDEQPVANRR